MKKVEILGKICATLFVQSQILAKKNTAREIRGINISQTVIFSYNSHEKMRIYFFMLLGSTPQRLHIR